MDMLKNLLPVLFFCCLCNMVIAQSKVEYKEIDYLKADGFSLPLKEKHGSRIGLKIINVNKKVVDINQDIKTTNFNITQPSLFDAFSKVTVPSSGAAGAGFARGDEVLMTAAKIITAVIPDSVRQQITALQDKYNKTFSTIIDNQEALDGLLQTYERIKQVLQFQSDMLMIQGRCDKTFEDIRSQVNEAVEATFGQQTYMDNNDRVLLIQKNYAANELILNRYVAKLIGDAKKYYDRLAQSYTSSKQDELVQNVNAIKKQIGVVAANLKKTMGNNDDAKALYKQVSTEQQNDKIGKAHNDEKDRYSKSNATGLHTDTEAFASAGKREFFDTYNYFTLSNWEYYVDPQTIESDLTVITVNIKPKADVRCTPLTRSYELRIRAKSGIKIDFSSGLFGNFGGNNFRDQTYRYDSIAGKPDQQKIVRNKNKNVIYPAIGALMHIYKRNGKDFQWAGAFGISSKDLEKVNYHIGGSAIFGYGQRFIVSAGLTLAKTTLISDKYYEGQVVDKAGAPHDIPTTSFNRIGYFFAFTYNLTAK